MLRWLARGPRVTVPLGLLMVYLGLSGVVCAAVYNATQVAMRPVVIHTEWRKIPWDLSNPFDRCLAAMQDAEIPGDMWDCYETPQPI